MLPEHLVRREKLRIRFKEVPWDIYVNSSYITVLSLSTIVSGIGTPFAALLVLLTPGYLAIATLFPRSDGIDWAERIVLSFILSVLLVPLTALIVSSLYHQPGVLRSLLAVDVLTVPLAFTSYWRRMQTPAGDRLELDFRIDFRSQSSLRGTDKLLAIFLGVSLVLAIGLLTYEAFQPVLPSGYTEFYLLGPSGKGADYPLLLNRSEEGRILIGVANRESSNATYLLDVSLAGVSVVFNNTTGSNSTIEVNRTRLSQYAFALGEDENRTQDYRFWINETGLWKLEFILFKNPGFSSNYLELHVFIRVE